MMDDQAGGGEFRFTRSALDCADSVVLIMDGRGRSTYLETLSLPDLFIPRDGFGMFCTYAHATFCCSSGSYQFGEALFYLGGLVSNPAKRQSMSSRRLISFCIVLSR
jgi:hypothetical protein